MSTRLEHANLSVRDIDAAIHFLTTALPDLKVRQEARDAQGERWVHLGSDDFYIALNQARATASAVFVPYAGQPGVNHLGWVVDDAAAVRRRLLAAGYTDSTYPNAHPHRTRVYFHEAEGNDWEFVEYRSAEPALRNDYQLPDRSSGTTAT